MDWKIDSELTIVVIGLGYVGLPTALAFSKKYKTIGVDTNEDKVERLRAEHATIDFYTIIPEISSRKVFLVTVPTPVKENKEPDLVHLIEASRSIGESLNVGDAVIYESTTFPGCTEDICIPELEGASRFKLNRGFGVGYSPERISPGGNDKIEAIVRVTSGSNAEVRLFVDELYRTVLNVKTHSASSIKVAEAAKLVENCQRDINISFVNELALIFDKMNLSTSEILEAAKTKWNFLDFRPGLVGGHCISVDPYYMIHKSKKLGYYPQVIGAGRAVNDEMGKFVAHKVMKLMAAKRIPLQGTKALILGFAYKANCDDFRNTKSIDIYEELKDFGLYVQITDSHVNPSKYKEKFGFELVQNFNVNEFDLIIHAVAHGSYQELYREIDLKRKRIVFDATNTWPRPFCDGYL